MIIEIEILNWEKYNPRKDIKHPTWFALNNRILEDPDFFDFSSEELKVFLYILCRASQKNDKTVSINCTHALRICGIKRQVIERTVQKLYALHVCAQSVRERDATDSTYRTVQTPARVRDGLVSELDFDFEKIYLSYPRKIGKKKGLETAKKVILNKQDFENLKVAIEKYSNHVKREKTESRYIQHFSTFMGSWEDWVDPTTGSVEKKKLTFEEMLANQEKGADF